ncbi:MAG: flagellin, partial [Arcobacteraceae bacterium]
MRINTNVASLTAMEANSKNNKTLGQSLEKLSTGLKINKASDDASGLSIADKLRTQANSLNQAVSNGNSGVALIQIADKAMAEQSNILDIIKQKLLQAGTATTSTQGIEAIGKDIKKLLDQIDNIAKQTSYNGIQLLQASSGSTVAERAVGTGQLKFQMGATSSDLISLSSGITSNTAGLDGMSALSISAAAWSAGLSSAAGMQSAARAHLASVDSALNTLNAWRSDVGS